MQWKLRAGHGVRFGRKVRFEILFYSLLKDYSSIFCFVLDFLPRDNFTPAGEFAALTMQGIFEIFGFVRDSG